MGIFTGGIGDEFITPNQVSATVVAQGGVRPSNAADTIVGGGGNDTIDAGGGDDSIDGGAGNDLLSGGGGADTFVWNPGSGSDTIDGGSGSDTLQFNGANIAEKINLSAGPDGHVILTRDVAAVSMDLDNVEHVAIRALGGADNLTLGDLSGTDIKSVDIDLGAGDGAVDKIFVGQGAVAEQLVLSTADGITTLRGSGPTITVANAESTDQIAIAGSADDDTLDASAANGMTVTFDGGAGNDLLSFKGTASGDVIQILSGGQPAANGDGAFVYSINGATESFSLFNVETVSINSGAGDDTITASSGLRALNIGGGAGDDLIFGSDNADTIDGGAGDDVIDGGRGGDLLTGGGGADTFVWNPGDGADTINGGSGSDTLQFNGANVAENISLSADADGHVILTRDVGAATLDLDNVEHLSIRALGGADHITVGDLSGAGVKIVDIDLGANGGGGDGLSDLVEVIGRDRGDHLVITGSGASATVSGPNGTVNLTNGEASDQLGVYGIGGNDVIDVSGYHGSMGLLLRGGDGSDRFLFAKGASAQAQIFDFQVHGSGPSADIVALSGYADRSLTDLVAHDHIAQSGSDVVITEDGLTLTLKNISLSALTSSDFLFA